MWPHRLLGRSEEIKEGTIKRLSGISKVGPKWNHKMSINYRVEAKGGLPQGKKAALPMRQEATCLALRMEDARETRTWLLPQNLLRKWGPAYTLFCAQQNRS